MQKDNNAERQRTARGVRLLFARGDDSDLFALLFEQTQRHDLRAQQTHLAARENSHEHASNQTHVITMSATKNISRKTVR